ncbi:MAG TPA: DUF3566 domain-containing protein [Streptosporangiaceae bacterium]
MSDATGAARNQGQARVTDRGGTPGPNAGRSGRVGPGRDPATHDDATVEVPSIDPAEPDADARAGAAPQAHVPPPAGPPGQAGPSGDHGRGGAPRWEPAESPHAAEPPWTATMQPSPAAVNRPGSPYGPAYGPGDTPPVGTSPPPPPPPASSGVSPGRLGRAAAAKVRASRRGAGGGVTTGKPPRRAHLQVSRFEPWSVMKFSFIMSLVCFVVLLVAVTVLYMILSGLGVFDAISSTINDLTREQGAKAGGLDAASWFSFKRVFGYTALIGSLNVLLITALATVWAVIYNLAADFVGGVEVTLKEAE